MTAVNSQGRQRLRQLRRRVRLQCRHRGCSCSLSACPAHQLCSLLAARCTKLCRVQSTYADWSTTKRRVSSGANPKPPELCGCVVWPGNKSNLDDVYGAADDGESSTICPLCLASPFSLSHFSLSLSLCSLRCSLWAIRSVATRFAWLHSLLACGLAGKLIEIFLIAFFSLSLLWP